MSTATKVPETWELTGDDARETLREIGTWTLAKDSFQRLRVSDGFSHARSLAYTISLLLVQAIIGLVGLASAFGTDGANSTVVRVLQAAVPGPAGDFLTSAVDQARRAGSSGQYLGLAFGLIGSLVTGATLMGQVERALNRMYGIEQDRPTLEKYRRALALAVSAGVAAGLACACISVGRSAGRSIGSDFFTVWRIVRWPAGLALMMASIALLFRWSPRRHQPSWSWLAFAATVSVVLWSLVTMALGEFFTLSSTFGSTYGPLAGIVGLLLWSFLSSVALLLGGAMAAQLESVRAGEPEPQDAQKVEESDPTIDNATPEPVGA